MREPEEWLAFTTADVQETVADVLDSGVHHDAMIKRAAAGLAVVCVDELRARHRTVSGRRVVLLVGSGNNGADALFAGVRLRRRGVAVDALLLAATAYQPAVAALRRAGGRLVSDFPPSRIRRGTELLGDVELADYLALETFLQRADLIVDGIVGDRGRGGLVGLPAIVAGCVMQLPTPVPVVAVDLPSGVDPDTGELAGPYLPADVTVTFGEAKPCLLLPPASHVAGRLVRVDVGMPRINEYRCLVRRRGTAGVRINWPVPDMSDHKYTRGVLGVIAGSEEYPGAAALVCLGAASSGVGMIRYIGPPRVCDHVLVHTPEVVPGSGRVQAWVLGPGITPGTHQNGAIGAALDTGLPCVVDAGALAPCVARRVRGEHAAPAHQVLLTPHAGELAALLSALGDDVDRSDVEARPLRHARQLAAEADATVLLKGATTLIVSPAGTVFSEQTAPAWLATAGAGDVLAGIAGTLLASGLTAPMAGDLAAVLHGAAATRASAGGPLSASRVAQAIPETLAEMIT